MSSDTDLKESLQILESFSALRREIGLIFAQELKAMNFGYNQMLVVYYLTKGPLPMNEISALSYSDPASTTRTVTSLEKAGLVKKSSDPKDSRRSIVELTRKGQLRAREVLKARTKLGERIGMTLPSKDRQQLVGLLEKVRLNLATPDQGVKK